MCSKALTLPTYPSTKSFADGQINVMAHSSYRAPSDNNGAALSQASLLQHLWEQGVMLRAPSGKPQATQRDHTCAAAEAKILALSPPNPLPNDVHSPWPTPASLAAVRYPDA